MTFAHLHCHTEHSLLDGLTTVDQLVTRVSDLGQDAVAITDHGVVSGHLKLQNACEGTDVKPIFGMEAYFWPDRHSREKEKVPKGEKGRMPYQHLTLLAKDQVGLRNLWILSTLAWTEGHYYKPRVDWEILEKHREGIIATTGCMNGAVASLYARARSIAAEGDARYDPEEAEARIARFLGIFGDDFLAELHTFDDPTQRAVNAAVAEAAERFGIQTVAVSDSHYPERGDWFPHEVLLATQFKKTLDDPDRYHYGPAQLHVMGENEVRERLAYLGEDLAAEAVRNAAEVAGRCGAVIRKERALPTFFETPKRDREKLLDLAFESFDRRMERRGIVGEGYAKYKARLLDELEVVLRKGFAGYFLIVHDLVSWAKARGILVGPSRGSAGGSLLSYALSITEIDPIEADLLFERFLAPDSDALPDIDIDFPVDRREEAREYLSMKYAGVAAIGTLGKQRPKALLRDVARALGNVPQPDIEGMARIVAATPKYVESKELEWSDVMESQGDALADYARRHPQMFEMLETIGGHLRQAGVHASGMIVSKTPLLGNIPLRTKDGEVRTQFDMWDVQALGYTKVDVLGLRTLATLGRVMEMAGFEHFYDWQYSGAHYADPEVYESLHGGKNIGIFQLESDGMRQLAKRHRPSSLEDLAEMVAIFRPGLTRSHDKETGLTLHEIFLRRRAGDMPPAVRHPSLEPIVGRTHGMFVYQEQIMRVVGDLAGYTPAERDEIRRLLGKRLGQKMQAQREDFVRRAQEVSGLDEVTASAVFDDMEYFGYYGFNRSHAWGYGLLAHWCAWPKHHYPREFMTALFQTNPDDQVLYTREARRMGIPVLGPDVRESGADFTLTEAGAIRYGLKAVKFVGSVPARKIVEMGAKNSWTLDFFFGECESQKITKRTVEALLVVGALDGLVEPEDYHQAPEWMKGKTESLALVAAHRFFSIREEHGHHDFGRRPLPTDPGKPPRYDWLGPDDQILESDFLLKDDGYLPVLSDEPQFAGVSALHRWSERNLLHDLGAREEAYLGVVVSVDPFKGWLEVMEREDSYPGILRDVRGRAQGALRHHPQDQAAQGEEERPELRPADVPVLGRAPAAGARVARRLGRRPRAGGVLPRRVRAVRSADRGGRAGVRPGREAERGQGQERHQPEATHQARREGGGGCLTQREGRPWWRRSRSGSGRGSPSDGRSP